MKKTQLVTVWFLPLIVIGGLFYPVLGYLVLAMIGFFLTLSFFKNRYWCWNLCPRGAFLDIALSKISRNKPVPRIFLKQYFRWSVFILFMGFLVFRIVRAGGEPVLIGSVFVGTCLLTTIIAIFLGVITKHRAWCMICPMGTLQEKIGKIKKQDGKKEL
ncbi:MAG: 4Fe-4S binding protein [Candidatus Omnitrophica bacterium]|nr:4Fe-4S binding protein [Candidatus Omnitrophota bacterium]MBU4149558.1 4Fe-4S binding protein [Candidatus Omnitrophota bacterium]